MKELIEWFDRSYIINLLDRPDRRQQVTREFHRLGINVPTQKVLFYNATRPADRGQFADVGTRGCFTSHRNILDLASKDHLRNILIFEDDVCFRRVDRALVRKLIDQLAVNDWDLVFFGYLSPPDDNLEGPLAPWSGDILGAHFYAVNGRFIGTMLQYLQECEMRPRDHPNGGPMPVDGAYNHVRYVIPHVSVMLAVPVLARQRSSRTDIASKRYFDEVVWLRPAMRGLRAIKHLLSMMLDRRKLRRRLERH